MGAGGIVSGEDSMADENENTFDGQNIPQPLMMLMGRRELHDHTPAMFKHLLDLERAFTESRSAASKFYLDANYSGAMVEMAKANALAKQLRQSSTAIHASMGSVWQHHECQKACAAAAAQARANAPPPPEPDMR